MDMVVRCLARTIEGGLDRKWHAPFSGQFQRGGPRMPLGLVGPIANHADDLDRLARDACRPVESHRAKEHIGKSLAAREENVLTSMLGSHNHLFATRRHELAGPANPAY